MTNNIIDIIIPTWNNTQYLQSCLSSILHNKTAENLFHIYVVNNGHENSCDWIVHQDVTVLQSGENLGWEGGLKKALEHSKAQYVLFLNDDTYIPDSSRMWLSQLIQHFRNPRIAAVGPSSNVVMGMQNIFSTIGFQIFPVKFLIGFCLMVRRSALDQVGGVDDTLPGGDDLDLSIRLRDAGYKLIVDREVFVYHHGFKTGERVHGTPDKTGGWNSFEFKEKTDFALITKHGFKKWVDCVMGVYKFDYDVNDGKTPEGWEDIEGDLIRERVKGGIILDLGCGAIKHWMKP
jgi:GT2 family glycosyltransferase